MNLNDEPKVWNRRSLRVPPGAIYVARPSKFGNPFSHRASKIPGIILVPSRDDAIRRFQEWVMAPEQAELREAARKELRGKDLVCWCAPQFCHADIWLEIANEQGSLHALDR